MRRKSHGFPQSVDFWSRACLQYVAAKRCGFKDSQDFPTEAAKYLKAKRAIRHGELGKYLQSQKPLNVTATSDPLRHFLNVIF